MLALADLNGANGFELMELMSKKQKWDGPSVGPMILMEMVIQIFLLQHHLTGTWNCTVGIKLCDFRRSNSRQRWIDYLLAILNGSNGFVLLGECEDSVL